MYFQICSYKRLLSEKLHFEKLLPHKTHFQNYSLKKYVFKIAPSKKKKKKNSKLLPQKNTFL